MKYSHGYSMNILHIMRAVSHTLRLFCFYLLAPEMGGKILLPLYFNPLAHGQIQNCFNRIIHRGLCNKIKWKIQDLGNQSKISNKTGQTQDTIFVPKSKIRETLI